MLVLWILGMMVQGHLLEFDRQTIHFYSNTLQAIAAGYLVASVFLFHLPVWGQVAGTAVLLVGYWLLMLLVPFRGHPAGTLEEKVNLALYIDEQVLGPFRDGTTYTWILSSMAFAGMVLMGVFAGHLLRSRWSRGMKVVWLVLWGVGCLAVAWLWSGGFDQWFQMTLVGNWRFPIIKHLFTSSMVLWADRLELLAAGAVLFGDRRAGPSLGGLVFRDPRGQCHHSVRGVESGQFSHDRRAICGRPGPIPGDVRGAAGQRGRSP